MCTLLVFSFYGIRRAHYEVFLATHIVLSITALWTMYYHVEIFTDGEWNIFVWPCITIWVFDRLLRLARIFAFNRNPFKTTATVKYSSDCNLVRMEVDGSTNWIATQPGTYYYIHVLDNLFYAYQSHPFTLAYTSSDVASSPPTTSSSSLAPISSMDTAIPSPPDDPSESDTLLTPKTAITLQNLVFLIRPYDGFTSRLKSYSLLHPRSLRVLVEGPYGHKLPLRNFTNVLFIVGGTGIAVPLSYIAHILSPGSYIRRAKVVWAVREHAFMGSVLRDLRDLAIDERLEMEIHITRDEQAMSYALEDEPKSVRIMKHRPDVGQSVQNAALDAGRQTLAIVACGPALMADQARKACVEMVQRGYTGVEYFEESFKW